MGKQNDWYENDLFWETVSPILFDDQRCLQGAADVEDVVRLLKIAPEAPVLDLCCGVGRHTLALSRYGFHVTGVDRTHAYLEQTRRCAEAEGLKIEFVEEDMRRFCRPEAFDAVINLLTSFGYFEDPEDDRRVVMNVYQSLRTGGAFVIEMGSKEVIARVFQKRDWSEKDGMFILEERNVTKNWSWMENRWIVFKDGEKREFLIAHRIYSATELEALLTACGFSTVDIYGDLKGSPYNQTAKRLVAVARK